MPRQISSYKYDPGGTFNCQGKLRSIYCILHKGQCKCTQLRMTSVSPWRVAPQGLGELYLIENEGSWMCSMNSSASWPSRRINHPHFGYRTRTAFSTTPSSTSSRASHPFPSHPVKQTPNCSRSLSDSAFSSGHFSKICFMVTMSSVASHIPDRGRCGAFVDVTGPGGGIHRKKHESEGGERNSQAQWFESSESRWRWHPKMSFRWESNGVYTNPLWGIVPSTLKPL